MKGKILSLLIVVLVVAAIRMPLLDIPFERDEGEYAYIAWRLGHHELPYRDWIDQKPPAVFWVYQLALSQLFGTPIRAVHIMGLLWSAASACSLFLLASRFLKPRWAAAAAVLFALLSADPSVYGTEANTELFMLLPLILSQIAFFASLTANRRGILFMILAGALTGCAGAFKQVGLVNWFFLVALHPVFATGEKRLRQTVSFAFWSAAGVAFIWSIVIAFFYLRHGLADFIYNVFTHNLEYIQAISWPQRLTNCGETLAVLWPTQAAVWLLSLACLVALFATRRIRLLLFLGGWMVSSWIGVCASGFFFAHYFQQMLPVLSVAAALGAETLEEARFWKAFPAWSRRVMLGGLLALPPLIVIFPFVFSYSPAHAVRKIYAGNDFEGMRILGERLAQMTNPEDRVFIFGAEPEVLFYAQRVSATRYIFLFPLYGPYRDALDKQTATANEITANRPAAALYCPGQMFFVPGSEQYFTGWSQSYLRSNFQVDTCLTLDPAENDHLYTGVGNQVPYVPDGQRIVGLLFKRRANP
jgi:4-amino-4-deoxy-L-arabinose transferase-like glycosyltransferase